MGPGLRNPKSGSRINRLLCEFKAASSDPNLIFTRPRRQESQEKKRKLKRRKSTKEKRDQKNKGAGMRETIMAYSEDFTVKQELLFSSITIGAAKFLSVFLDVRD